VGALLLVIVGRALARRHRLVAQTAREVRTPLLYLPTDITDERMLGIARRVMDRATPIAPGVTGVAQEVPGAPGDPVVPTIRYERPGRRRPGPAVVWIHGGGTIAGTPASAHAFCSRLAAELDVLVISVDYRLAPEHPFPAGLDDCAAALAWLHDHATDLGVDPQRIAVGGDSAGGGLAASLAQLARDRGEHPVAFQLLVYPMLDDRTVLRAEEEGRDALIWSPGSNRFAWTAYLGHPPTDAPERPYAAAARCEDLAGLAPAWIGVGDIDLFAPEDLDYARRLTEAGVRCDVHVEPGLYHGADAVLPEAATSRSFRDRMVTALADALAVARP
jgi:acetyl esterase/lipase